MEFVLITGGSSGIGYALAEQFAQRKYGIAIAASNQKRLESVKEKLEKKYSVPIKIYQQNLAQAGGAQELYEKIKQDNIEIDVLVNNAGYGQIGAAEEIDFEKDYGLMVLNMIAVTELCKLFLRDMYAKQRGKILNVASTGAFQPGPYTASYYASKAYVLSYSRAIRQEAKRKNVQICTLCPGTTDTEFFHRIGKKTPKGAMTPEKTAAYAYRKLMKNKEVIVPGILNKILRIVPVPIKIFFVAQIKGKK